MTTRTRLVIATLLSAALHAVLISGEWTPMPQAPGAPRPLEARLASLPELKPAAPKPRIRAPRRVAPVPAPEVAAIAAPGSFALPNALDDEDMAEAPSEEPAAPEPPQRLALAAETSVDASTAHALPRRGQITYTLFYGEERFSIGNVVQSWEAGAGSYLLASAAETAGLIELLWPQRLRYVSRGRITRNGMQPESFLASRTRRGRNEVAEARFDWEAGRLSYGRIEDRKSAPLSAGAQDVISVIFQFVLAPPAPGRYRVPITTGSRFDVHEIEVSAEERIETPLGMLRALPVRQLPRPGEPSFEIWLAVDYRYLPVRIRHFDRRGNFTGEQMVNEIRVSDE
ncbi:MAG TPA: DUF3108 domain-containing protein [Burkholderiales bacterium]|jgi:hypothetical protein